ncbi:MAG: saccharopine dehydrogenase family protein [Flavobacteriales bacterium]
MGRITIIGAGKSASALISYLLGRASDREFEIRVLDQDIDAAQSQVEGTEQGSAASFDAEDEASLAREVAASTLVVSMLPALFHPMVARECIRQGKHLITPSYLSQEVRDMDREAIDAGVLIMNEMGVDPGIDHMSAMQGLDRIREQGYRIRCLESFTGGLVAPDSDDNPWGYKFTWSPRNVVLAGQGGAVKFLQEGRYKYIPSYRIFKRAEMIDIEGYGRFEGYANRDSLRYRSVYGLEEVPTIFRGTLRRPGFCKAWDVFVQLGATDDSYVIEGSEEMSKRQFINAFLTYDPHDSVELKLMHYLGIDRDSEVMEKLYWLGIFEEEPIGLKDATPAQILQRILEDKWALGPNDRDMIVMFHKFGYCGSDGTEHELRSSMVHLGKDPSRTAMAECVGLPIGIMARMIMDGEVEERGVHLPILPSVYAPLLQELEAYGIRFQEEEVEPSLPGTFQNARSFS